MIRLKKGDRKKEIPLHRAEPQTLSFNRDSRQDADPFACATTVRNRLGLIGEAGFLKGVDKLQEKRHGNRGRAKSAAG